MRIEENVSLKNYNTFGIDVCTRYYAEVKSIDDLIWLMAQETYRKNPRLILGGGSNVLFTKDYDGLIIRNLIMGKSVKKLNTHSVIVTAGGGESWHPFVIWTIENHFAGLENLSLIPGQVGAAPMQNIGAYGVEIKDVFHELEAVDMHSGEQKTFQLSDCGFGYRESVFKHEHKDKYLITSVSFLLTDVSDPSNTYKLKTNYGDIRQALSDLKLDGTAIKHVSDAVIKIRQSKLPDPAVLGNAGSFFKNPTVSKAEADKLLLTYPLMPNYPNLNNSDEVKIPAGWLIEQCGWKGKVVGHTGSHKTQALVLVNYGGATGDEVWKLSMEIKQSVLEKFGIDITPEVNVY